MPYLEVIPLRKLPPQFQSLDYKIENDEVKKITIGQLVEVPLRSQNILAIVIKIKNFSLTPPEKIKPINKIIASENYLSKNQLALFDYLAKYYLVSPALFIKTLIPHPPGKKIKNPTFDWLWPASESKITKKVETNNILKNKKTFIYYQNYEDRLAAYHSLAEKIVKNDSGQIFILVPTKKELREISAYLLNFFKKDYFSLITSDLSNAQIYFEWQKIKSQERKIIIGTKVAVFSPFAALKTAVIDNEHDLNHQQTEINPRYDARLAVEKLAELEKIPLILTSFAPRVETYWRLKNKEYRFLSLRSGGLEKKPKIIDLKDEHRAGNFLMLSQSVQDSIKNILVNHEKIFLFLNRRGFSPLTVCQDCGTMARCPNCQISLGYHQASHELICHRCGYQTDEWLTCPNCRGTNIKNKSGGTEKLITELKIIFPKEKIIIYDSDHQLLNRETLEQTNIIVGTRFALENLDLEKFKLIVSVSTDNLFSQNDFRSFEETFQTLKSLMIYPTADLLIQTYSPDNPAIRFLTDLNKFYRQELISRAKFNYPPYVKIAKLILKDPNENNVKKESEELFKKINDLKLFDDKMAIIGPLVPWQAKLGKNYRCFIIIKYGNSETLAKIAALVYNKKIILEVSPNSLNN